MSTAEVKIDEVEPTQDQLEKAAAKQLLAEMFMIQRRIYGMTMNSMLLVQLKQLTRGLMNKYRSVGLFIDDNIEVKFIRKLNQVEFVPSQHLKTLFTEIQDEAIQQELENRKQDADEALNA